MFEVLNTLLVFAYMHVILLIEVAKEILPSSNLITLYQISV